jgi:glucose dehydrogenase
LTINLLLMGERAMKKSLLLVGLTFITLAMLSAWANVMPISQDTMSSPRIFAYRDWQSVEVQVQPGDVVEIRAEGDWLYTPNEYNGPEGHTRYTAPDFYPLPGERGGALIGRLGENGLPFYVGQYTIQKADQPGMLYLRINDDILSDNKGDVTVEINLESSALEP